MRIRDTLLALTATVVAGSAIAAVATPAAAQGYYHPGYERGYAPAYGRGYESPRFEHRLGYDYPAPAYGYGADYGYGYGYYHPHHYRHFWR